MRSSRIICFLLFCVLLAATSLSAQVTPEKWGAVPLSFEPNRGQTAADVQFLARGAGYGMFFTRNEAIISFTHPQAATVRMKLVGQNKDATIQGLQTQVGSSHYFMGS